jgi:hypothetical protein
MNLMKKVFVMIITVFLLATVASSAFSENIDLSALTNDELLSLKQELTDEINLRGINEKHKIYIGEYCVGTDILSGVYLFTCDDTSDVETRITVFPSMSAKQSVRTVGDRLQKSTFLSYLEEGNEIAVPLSDGDILCIDFSACMISNAEMPFKP